jgi:hypothetical protein
MKQQLLLMFSVLALLTSSVLAGEEKIFRWQDESGTWHYSATPPAGQTVEAINIKAPPTSGTTEKHDKGTDTDKTADNAKVQNTPDTELKKSAEVAAEDKALADKNCKNARANLTNLTNHRRMRINDEETGEVRYLSDEEHAEWMKRSKEEVRKYCK